MAKALVGHLLTDTRTLQGVEASRLRCRVVELQSALERECRANDELTRRLLALSSEMRTSDDGLSVGDVSDEELRSLAEPALT